jgi:hypothetical protein
MNFAYSFTAGLLAGNANIVRLPAKDFPQIEIALSEIRKILKEKTYKHFAKRIIFIKYETTKETHDFFSSICDIRVIWGGDETIKKFRKSPLKTRAIEINFADRYSFAVIDSNFYIREKNKAIIANNFYNDTYFSDQNACTSPRIIIWTGSKTEEAKDIFWDKLKVIVTKKYTFAPVQATGKLLAFTKLAVDKENIKYVASKKNDSNAIFRITASEIFENIKDYAYHSGFFLEYNAKSLNEILPMIDSRVQTLSYCAEKNDVKKWFEETRPRGIDRIVPFGKTMDFSLTWDGIDLIKEMSRVVEII